MTEQSSSISTKTTAEGVLLRARAGEDGGDVRETRVAPADVRITAGHDPRDVDVTRDPLRTRDRSACAGPAPSGDPSVLGAIVGKAHLLGNAAVGTVLGVERGTWSRNDDPNVGRRIDPAIHKAQPWRIHQLAHDFELHDFWSLPVVADPKKGETFEQFFDIVCKNGFDMDNPAADALVWIRGAMGRVLGWDKGEEKRTIPGTETHSIAERMSAADRRESHVKGPFETPWENLRVAYQFKDEAVVEASNSTIHVLIHFSWGDAPEGKKTPQLAVYTKSRGLKSKLYLAAIEPFRPYLIYPSYTRHLGELWRERAGKPVDGARP